MHHSTGWGILKSRDQRAEQLCLVDSQEVKKKIQSWTGCLSLGVIDGTDRQLVS